MTSEFTWLSGGPDEVPSTFQFQMAGAILKEEIYERTEDRGKGGMLLRYRTLEPALGVIEYDAILKVRELAESHTGFEAVREVRLLPGTSPDMLADIVRSETQFLKEHFAA